MATRAANTGTVPRPGLTGRSSGVAWPDTRARFRISYRYYNHNPLIKDRVNCVNAALAKSGGRTEASDRCRMPRTDSGF